MPRPKGKAHTMNNFHHIRVGPERCRVVGTITLSKEKEIKARVCCPVGQIGKDGTCKVGTKIKSVLYPRSRYSRRQAESHAKQFL